jgi:hypothetical protein
MRGEQRSDLVGCGRECCLETEELSFNPCHANDDGEYPDQDNRENDSFSAIRPRPGFYREGRDRDIGPRRMPLGINRGVGKGERPGAVSRATTLSSIFGTLRFPQMRPFLPVKCSLFSRQRLSSRPARSPHGKFCLRLVPMCNVLALWAAVAQPDFVSACPNPFPGRPRDLALSSHRVFSN